MTTKIFVGNLSFDSTEATITKAFSNDSRSVKNVNVITDFDSQRSRGFAFVEMATEADARAAIEALDGTELDGRTLRVDEAKEQRPRAGA